MSNGYSEIYTEVTNKANPFKKYQTTKLASQVFDKEKITVKRKGQIINVWDWTQSTAEQNDFYKALEHYADVDDATEAMCKKYQQMSSDIANIRSLEDIHELTRKAQQMWDNLDLKTRAEFGNNKANLIAHGQEWFNNKAKIYKDLVKKQQEELEALKNQQGSKE